MYEFFVVQGLSFYKIAKKFNELKIDDWSGWNEAGIKKMLWSASAVGVFIWNKYRNEYDHERKRMVREPNPRRDKDLKLRRHACSATKDLSKKAGKTRKICGIKEAAQKILFLNEMEGEFLVSAPFVNYRLGRMRKARMTYVVKHRSQPHELPSHRERLATEFSDPAEVAF